MTDDKDQKTPYLVTPFPIKHNTEDKAGSNRKGKQKKDNSDGPEKSFLSPDARKKMKKFIESAKELRGKHQELKRAYREVIEKLNRLEQGEAVIHDITDSDRLRELIFEIKKSRFWMVRKRAGLFREIDILLAPEPE